MNYNEILEKLERGEALTPEEVTDLKKESRPSYRLTEEVTKRKELDTQLNALKEENAKLKEEALNAKQKIQDAVNVQLSEMSSQLETISKDNVALKQAKDQFETLLKVTQLATKNEAGVVFKNPDYLAFRMNKEGIDLNDSEKVNTFLNNLKAQEPELCMVAVKGGAGAGIKTDQTQGAVAKSAKDMSISEKTAYIKEHGCDAYMQLLNKE